MSYFVAGAVVVSAAAGAYSSNKASKEQSKGVQKGLDQSAALAQQARQDVMSLFERSATNSGMGMKAALDYYKTAAPKRAQPYIQGSSQAQQVIGQGAVQANNAILGLPVDMGFVNQPQIVPGTDHMIGAQIPEFKKGSIVPEPEPEPEKVATTAGQKSTTGSKIGGIIDKHDPVKKVEKLFKKIF